MCSVEHLTGEGLNVLTHLLMRQHGLEEWELRSGPRTRAGDKTLFLAPGATIDNVLHAIAHAVAGPDHDEDWTDVAELIGADISVRCERLVGFLAVCPCCAGEFVRDRAPRAKHHCLACGPNAVLEFFDMS